MEDSHQPCGLHQMDNPTLQTRFGQMGGEVLPKKGMGDIKAALGLPDTKLVLVTTRSGRLTGEEVHHDTQEQHGYPQHAHG